VDAFHAPTMRPPFGMYFSATCNQPPGAAHKSITHLDFERRSYFRFKWMSLLHGANFWRQWEERTDKCRLDHLQGRTSTISLFFRELVILVQSTLSWNCTAASAGWCNIVTRAGHTGLFLVFTHLGNLVSAVGKGTSTVEVSRRLSLLVNPIKFTGPRKRGVPESLCLPFGATSGHT
jgi:hypothetical protein